MKKDARQFLSRRTIDARIWVIASACVLLFQNCAGYVALPPTAASAAATSGTSGTTVAGGTTTTTPATSTASPSVSSSLHTGNAKIDGLNAQINVKDSALDYVIQDVCVDGNDQVIAGDPTVCGNHRNVRIGEKVPYILTDMDTANGNATYQALFSYPVPGEDYSLKILVPKNGQGSFNSSFALSFDQTRDGYDLLDASTNQISAIRTSDPGCLDQLIYGTSTQRTGGWIFFTKDMGSASLRHDIIMQRLNPNVPAACKAANVDSHGNYKAISSSSGDAALDVWNAPSGWTFTSGKTLQSIITYHYANYDLSKTSNALERYFFTREYGFTRWEAWQPLARCHNEKGSTSPVCNPTAADNPLRGRCEPSTGTASWGNQTWVRVDCRDTTHYMQISTPLVPLDSTMGQNDGKLDIESRIVFGL